MDTVFLALRVVVALGAVFGALLLAHRWITKGRPGAAPRNRQISVVARQGLGQKAGIAVVDAGGRRYLLGVTEHAVTVLDRLDGTATAGQQTSLTVMTATGPVPAVGPSTQSETRVVSVLSTGPVPSVGGQETRVVSVMTTGPVATDRLGSEPGLPTFEQQLAFAASFTDTITLPASSGRAEPLPEVFRIEPATGDGTRRGSARTDAPRARPAARTEPDRTDPDPAQPAEAAPAQPLTRRAARAAETAKGSSPGSSSPSPLAGSILSPETWRQTAAALKRAR